KRSGIIVPFLYLLQEKGKLVTVIVGCFFFLLFSNMIWQVKIDGVSYEIERELRGVLEKHGVYRTGFKFAAPSIAQLEQQVQKALPQLLYITIEKKGVSYTVKSEEKK